MSFIVNIDVILTLVFLIYISKLLLNIGG